MKKGPFDFVYESRPASSQGQQADYDEFEATELYCRQCGRAVPVRKSLLLVLPNGDKYEYRCQFCGSTVGDKIDHSGGFQGIIKT